MAEFAEVHGLEETLKALRALPKAISGKGGGPLRKALFAAAKVVKAEVKQSTPVRSGLLRDSIATFRDRKPESIGAAEHYTVGIRKQRKKYRENYRNARLGRIGKSYSTAGAAYYGKFVEFGTSKMAKHPFMRPAFESSKQPALTAFENAMRKEVGKAVEQAKRG